MSSFNGELPYILLSPIAVLLLPTVVAVVKTPNF